MKQVLCNDPVDVQWLKDTHIKHLNPMPEFKAFEMLGNEDAPDKVILYADVCPLVFDQPTRVLVCSGKTGKLV